MIGDKLKVLLKQRGMKQTELANITGIPKQTINSIITRNNKNVDFSAMEKIADALHVPIEYFFDRADSFDKKQPVNNDELNRRNEFFNLFSALPNESQALVLDLLKALAKH